MAVYFRTTRLWRDEQERNHSEFEDSGSYELAKPIANAWLLKGGEVWIEQRDGRSRPILTDRKGEDQPMTREHLTQLQEQVRALALSKRLPKGDAA